MWVAALARGRTVATSRLCPGRLVTGRGTVRAWVNPSPRRLGALRLPRCGSWVRAFAHSAPLCAVRHRSADRVNLVVRDEEVGVRPGRAEGVVAGSREREAFLPPAVLGGDHRGIERCVELRFHRYRSRRGLQENPFLVLDLCGRGGGGVDLQERLTRLASQSRQVAVSVVAVLQQAGEGERERVVLHGAGPGGGRGWLPDLRQRRVGGPG